MAKEIIDRIVQAEADSGARISEATGKAELLKKATAAEAEAAYAKAVADAGKKAAAALSEAEQKADIVVEQAVKKALGEKAELMQGLEGRMREAADEIIKLITD